MKVVKMFDLGQTFGIATPAPIQIPGNDQPGPFTPPVNPEYFFRRDLVFDMVNFFVCGDVAMYLTGHKGSGKSTLVEQYHARLNLPLYSVNVNPRTEIADLIGHWVLKGQEGMQFHYGPVARAAKEGASVLLDEYNLLDPGIASGLNGALEGKEFYIPETEEVIRPREGFRIFATGNHDDGAGVYRGRQQGDAANEDRFWFLNVGYPTRDEEIPLVKRIWLEAGLDDSMSSQFATGMVEIANKLRALFIGSSDAADAIEVTMSTRSLLRWARLSVLFRGVERRGSQPIHYALERALTNRPISPETKVAIHEIVKDVMGIDYTPQKTA